jgi:hypothetical protein
MSSSGGQCLCCCIAELHIVARGGNGICTCYSLRCYWMSACVCVCAVTSTTISQLEPGPACSCSGVSMEVCQWPVGTYCTTLLCMLMAKTCWCHASRSNVYMRCICKVGGIFGTLRYWWAARIRTRHVLARVSMAGCHSWGLSGV